MKDEKLIRLEKACVDAHSHAADVWLAADLASVADSFMSAVAAVESSIAKKELSDYKKEIDDE